MTAMAVSFNWLLIVAMTLQPPAPEKAISAQDEAKIRRLLNSEEAVNRGELAKHGGLSPAAFPLYARILDDPKEDARLASRVLWAITLIKGDRCQFVDRAVA